MLRRARALGSHSDEVLSVSERVAPFVPAITIMLAQAPRAIRCAAAATGSGQASGSASQLLPGDLAPGPADRLERPLGVEPASDLRLEHLLEIAVLLVAAHPQADLGVGTLLLRRVDVDAAEQAVLAGGHHRVVERAPQLRLLLMPAEVDQVVLDRHPGIGPAPVGESLAETLGAAHHGVVVVDDVVDREDPQVEAVVVDAGGDRMLERDQAHGLASSTKPAAP